MNYSIVSLVENDSNILKYYKRGKELWAQLLTEIDIEDGSNVPELAKKLFSYQLLFEHQCGGRWLGQEIMVITGIVPFYRLDVGFERMYDEKTNIRYKKAYNIYKAFATSTCSMEVKYKARKVSEFFDLVEAKK